jgi:TRAP-type C4-dicarboxylate transport system permease small subunit
VAAKLERAWIGTLRACAGLSGLGLFLLSVMITGDVMVRWLTGRPIIGVFEIAEVLFVLVTFFAVALVYRDDRQLRVDALSALARGRTAASLRLLDGIAGLLFFFVVLWTGGAEWLKAYLGGFLRRGLVEIPSAIPLGFIVLGSLLLCAVLLAIVGASLRRLIARSGNGAADAG